MIPTLLKTSNNSFILCFIQSHLRIFVHNKGEFNFKVGRTKITCFNNHLLKKLLPV